MGIRTTGNARGPLMSEMAAADVIDLRDGEKILLAVLGVLGQRAGRVVDLSDVDRDLERDLGLRPCQRYEVAGVLADLMALPGGDDDTVNSCVIETLALSRTPRSLALNVGAVHRGALETLGLLAGRWLRVVPATGRCTA